MIAGALGPGPESDDKAWMAAYGYHPEAEAESDGEGEPEEVQG